MNNYVHFYNFVRVLIPSPSSSSQPLHHPSPAGTLRTPAHTSVDCKTGPMTGMRWWSFSIWLRSKAFVSQVRKKTNVYIVFTNLIFHVHSFSAIALLSTHVFRLPQPILPKNHIQLYMSLSHVHNMHGYIQEKSKVLLYCIDTILTPRTGSNNN